MATKYLIIDFEMLTDLIGTSFSSRVTFKTKNSSLFMIHVYNFFLNPVRLSVLWPYKKSQINRLLLLIHSERKNDDYEEMAPLLIFCSS